MRFLDLSDNNVDKRAIELLVQALTHTSQTTDTASKAKPSPLVQAGQAISNGTSSKGSQLADRSRATAGQMPQNGQPSQLADPAGKGSADARVWEGREGEVLHQTILDLGQEGEGEEDEQPLVPLAPLLKDDSTNDPAAAITSLRLENCGLKNNTLEILGELEWIDQGPEFSCLTAVNPSTGACSSWCSVVEAQAHFNAAEQDHSSWCSGTCYHDSRLPGPGRQRFNPYRVCRDRKKPVNVCGRAGSARSSIRIAF